jgi:hypothetical protein
MISSPFPTRCARISQNCVLEGTSDGLKPVRNYIRESDAKRGDSSLSDNPSGVTPPTICFSTHGLPGRCFLRRPERRLGLVEVLLATPPLRPCDDARIRNKACCRPCGAAGWRGSPVRLLHEQQALGRRARYASSVPSTEELQSEHFSSAFGESRPSGSRRRVLPSRQNWIRCNRGEPRGTGIAATLQKPAERPASRCSRGWAE